MGFYIHSDAPEALPELGEDAVFAQYLRWQIIPGAEHGQFRHYLLQRFGLSPENAAWAETVCKEQFEFGMYDRPRIMLQPHFPDINIAGRALRADGLLYIPGNLKARIIVECDSWRFHKDKRTLPPRSWTHPSIY
jgi:hypothetical protein